MPTTSYDYQLPNVNPGTQSGSGAFGAVPGAIGGVNPYQASYTAIGSPSTVDLSSIYPHLAATNASASDTIMRELMGAVSPGTQNAIQSAAASWGVGSGMPGSGLGLNYGLASLGQTSEGIQRQGMQDYLSAVSPQMQLGAQEYNANAQNQVNSTNAGAANQTAQFNANALNQGNSLNTEIAATNALNASAPNPAQAQSYAQSLYQQMLAQYRNPAGTLMSQSNGGRNTMIPGMFNDFSAGGGGGASSPYEWDTAAGGSGSPYQVW